MKGGQNDLITTVTQVEFARIVPQVVGIIRQTVLDSKGVPIRQYIENVLGPEPDEGVN